MSLTGGKYGRAMMLYTISSAPPEIRRWGESGNWIAYDPDSGAHLIRPKGIKTHRGRPWYILVVPHRPEWATPPHTMFAFEKHNLGADSLDDALRQAEEWLPKLLTRKERHMAKWATVLARNDARQMWVSEKVLVAEAPDK